MHVTSQFFRNLLLSSSSRTEKSLLLLRAQEIVQSTIITRRWDLGDLANEEGQCGADFQPALCFEMAATYFHQCLPTLSESDHGAMQL